MMKLRMAHKVFRLRSNKKVEILLILTELMESKCRDSILNLSSNIKVDFPVLKAGNFRKTKVHYLHLHWKKSYLKEMRAAPKLHKVALQLKEKNDNK